jgi:hypothetical protein
VILIIIFVRLNTSDYEESSILDKVMPAYPSFLAIPLEIRDEIIEIFIFHTDAVSPPAPALAIESWKSTSTSHSDTDTPPLGGAPAEDSQPRPPRLDLSKTHPYRIVDPTFKQYTSVQDDVEIGKCFVYKTLLLVSRQVHEETIAVMRRFLSSGMEKMRYKLDIILEREDRLYASWTRLPFFRDPRILSTTSVDSGSSEERRQGQEPVRVDTVDVNIRIVGSNGPNPRDRGTLIRAGCGGPGIIVWPLLRLLDGFIRYGPSFRPEQSQETSFIPLRVPASDQLEAIATSSQIATKANLLTLAITPCYAFDPCHGKPGWQTDPRHSTAGWISYGMGFLTCRGGRESKEYGNYLRAGVGRVELYDIDEKGKISKGWDVDEVA